MQYDSPEDAAEEEDWEEVLADTDDIWMREPAGACLRVPSRDLVACNPGAYIAASKFAPFVHGFESRNGRCPCGCSSTAGDLTHKADVRCRWK